MYLQLGDALVNTNNVDFVQRDYLEDVYVVAITFTSGAYVKNTFDTKEEADELFNKIGINLNATFIA